MYTPFKLDLIYNMDHMRISDTQPSSVISKYFKPKNKLCVSAHLPMKYRVGR